MENNTEKQLVEFGKYLLSDERKNRIASGYSSEDNISLDERLKEVYDADVANFYEIQRLKNVETIITQENMTKYFFLVPYVDNLLNYRERKVRMDIIISAFLELIKGKNIDLNQF